MRDITSASPSFSPRLPVAPLAVALAVATSTAYAGPAGDLAATGAMQAKDLDAVEVIGQAPAKADSPKYTEALLDTPQTITVITKDVMDQQGLLGLQDVLSTLPGITFGAGEGGGGYGDKINLRGFDATSDITVDGVRDSGLYTRSDTFNIESLELVNGANSAYSGAGSVGGNINLVSKTAREGDSSTVTVGAGTDNYGRVTADSNFDLDNGIAIRLNAIGHIADMPGRGEEFEHRWGFAPSVAFGLGSDTRFTLSYLHQEDRNLPQYGTPYALNDFNDGPLPGVDPSTYFGYRNTSRQEVTQDMLTGVLEMSFGDNLELRSLGRLQQVDQMSSISALQGTWCTFDGVNPFTGGACAALPDGSQQPSGTWSPTGGPRGLVRDTRNTIAYSQTDLSTRFQTGVVRHSLVAGVSFSREQFELDTGSIFRNADGSTLPNDNTSYPLQDLRNPYNIWTGPVNYFRTGRSEGELSNQAIYVFDTLHFGEKWLLNLGARYENVEGSSTVFEVSDEAGSIGRITGAGPVYKSDDELFSYRAGLIYKPTGNGSVYLSYANSKTPSKSSVNGSCAPARGNPVDSCNVAPESAVNIELGTKWDIVGGRLSLTGAVFRNDRENYRVSDPGNPDNPSGVQVLDGQARVDGVALGAAGHITEAWSVFANYTFLDSEVLQSVSDFVDGTDGDPLAGRELSQTPRHSGSIWTTYALDAWTFGYGANYQGTYYPNNSDDSLYHKTDAYWVHRAMVGYRVNDALSLQLNVDNLFDKEYYTNIRNNTTSGWAIPGDGRSAVLTATYRF
ncbi:TonB-dependent receptor [Marilutibacter chinensis]|uniref:TonB-dependent siderophore receptor n=1 Tax=Marilutibacter chinensis TaxID=2912247 RepID=A0ABS9HWC9_9GAMM|nr:TonB-dependent siderophore receptor [Lysobacter chinensis]MCF7222437.1 TonB-dependent siderophore receptor [Lysobacter chinensis]